MTDLPDVNVWLALVDENHAHHEKAVAYWQGESGSEIAFCRVTMLAFLRLATHPKVLSRALSPREAWDIYQLYRINFKVGFVFDSPEVDRDFMELSNLPGLPHHLWTDCYLAALAGFQKCRIVSFDQDFGRFSNTNFLHLST
jgi:toxin-antitoxin system PIN domain toxin